MSKQPKTISVAMVVGFAALLGASALAWPSMLGWAIFLNFGIAGLASFLGAVGIVRRRASVAFGACLIVTAVMFGALFSELALPRWFQPVSTSLFLVSVAWFVRESRRADASAVSAV